MKKLFYFLGVGFIFLFAQCQKDELISDNPDFKLEFSNDTVLFDTIFNGIGSTTRTFKVYNRNNRAVKIANIRLKQITPGYRINVDGISGTNFSDVELVAGDSLFIFIEVTVNPNDELHPFVEDELEFITNGNTQTVKLVAWGWDAIVYRADVFPTNGLPSYVIINPTIGSVTTWNSDKPILIYGGFAVVDSATTLNIEEGTQIYSHFGSGLWVYRDGSLSVNGTAENPVVFQGDRLEDFYKEVPGQWDRIWINEGAEDVNIDYCVIKNAFVGLQLEPVPFFIEPAPNSGRKVRLNNVAVRNCSLYGIYCRNYNVDGNNLLVSNCGFYLFAVSGGGSYNFNHCTFANYWNESNRTTPAFLITNTYETAPNVLAVSPILSSHFSNMIVYGNIDDEFQLALDDQNVSNELKFEYSIVKSTTTTFGDANRFFGGMLPNQDPLFTDANEGNYKLTSISPAIGSGTTNPANPANIPAETLLDLFGETRGDNVDMGAIEFVP
jgi:hypothetical protein